MHIEKITYQKAFPIGPFLQEKLGIEIILNDTPPEVAYSTAKKIVEKWHEENNPHLYNEEIKPLIQEAPYESVVDAEDQALEMAKKALEAIEFQEEALTYLNNNGWTYTRSLKEIALSKPKKLPEQ